MLDSLHPISTSQEHGPFREYPAETWHLKPNNYINLDFTTLVYEFYRSKNGNVVLFCPRLYNLFDVLADHLHNENGVKLSKIKRQKFGLWERIEILDSFKLKQIYFRNSIFEVRQPLQQFQNRNVMVTMNKDNPIEWIVDWVNFHKIHHNADAILIFDNSSSTYSIEELERELILNTDLKDILVVSADLPYGFSRDLKNGSWRTQFLQTACLNIAKEIYFSDANAVLSIDIDEFVEPMNETNVFNVAQKSPLGQVVWEGTWSYCVDNFGPRPQKEHTLVSYTIRDGGRKWCAVPSRFMGRREWMIHGHYGLYGVLTKTKSVHHWHFRNTSTSWKYNRNLSSKEAMVDTALVSAMAVINIA